MMTPSRRACLLLVLAWSGCVTAQERLAPPVGTEPRLRKTAVVPRIDEAPVIDGDLSDPAWLDAVLITDFTQLLPSPGRAPRQCTEVRMMFDADNLYIGARMFDDEPARIIANQMVQGQAVVNDDYIQILLDPLDSGRRSYIFYVNPNSVQRDGLTFGDTAFNMNWDGIWHARARIDAEGWSAEVAMPFRTLSFDPAREDWGLTVARGVARSGEVAAWSFRDFRLTNDSFGQIRGIRGLEQGMGLDVTPSLVWRERRRYGRDVTQRRIEPSLDAFYRFTPSLIGALTVNTDFSATEVDDRQVNLTRFSLFFPEKREFFLQDADIFEFADLQQNGRPFFSRTIGLSGFGQPVDLVAGAKLTGRIGPWNLGFLGVQQDEDGDVDADLVLVARASVDVLEASSLGLIATHGDPRSKLESWLVGTDWNYRNTTWLTGQVVEAGAWLQRSYTQGASGDDGAWGLRVALPNDRLEARASVVELQRNFRPAMGFVNRRDIRQFDTRLYRRWREPVPWLRAWRSGVELQQVTDLNGRLETSLLKVVPADLQLAGGDVLNLYWQRHREVLDRPFTVVGNLVIEPGIYEFERFGAELSGAGFRLEAGEFFDGRRLDASLRSTWTPNRHLLFDATYAVNRLQVDGGSSTTRLMSLLANVAFNVRWAWSNSVQYDNVSERLGFSSRLRYVPRLGQSLTLAVNHDLELDAEERFNSQQREISARASYTLRY